MPRYRRPQVTGGTYFITQVTYQRSPWLCKDVSRRALREAIAVTRQKHPFSVDAIVLLPEHFHCLLTLPPNDSDFSTRLKNIKAYVTRHYKDRLGIDIPISESRRKRGEQNLWQRRFWDHWIRNEQDFENHCDYIHYNPVRHGLCRAAQEWKFSSIHRFIAEGIYPNGWGRAQEPIIPHAGWDR